MTVADLIWKLLYYPYDMEVKVCVRPRVEPAASVDTSIDISRYLWRQAIQYF